jgi:hypothetical protein
MAGDTNSATRFHCSLRSGSRSPRIVRSAGGLVEGVLEGGEVQSDVAPVVGRAAARVGKHEDALVGGRGAAAAVEAVDAVARRDALELEVVEAVEIDAAGRFRMDAEIVGLGSQALGRVHERAMREGAVGRHGIQRETQRRTLRAERRFQRLEQRVEIGGFVHRHEQLDRAHRRPAPP